MRHGEGQRQGQWMRECGYALVRFPSLPAGDLKPDNVLLKVLHAQGPVEGTAPGTAAKQDVVVAKVGDFGLSVFMEPNMTHASNITKGTPYYVAPEVVSRKQVRGGGGGEEGLYGITACMACLLLRIHVQPRL